MGGDFAPEETIKGSILALENINPENQLVLLGNEDLILNELKKQNVDSGCFEIIDCKEIVDFSDHPVKAFKEKQDSSIVKGFMLLKQKTIDGFASAGSTGAMLVGATMITGIIEGITRPCISSFYPNISGSKNLLLDVGLNADVKPENILQFAQLGYVFYKQVMKEKNPKVGLLNIGSEESKGNLLAKTAFDLLKNDKSINFIGNIESYDLLDGNKVNVVVTDGFTGNIVLKQFELFYKIIKERNIDDDYFENYNYENYGGTPILGVNQPIIIGHGKSSAKAIKNMILLTEQIVNANL